MEGQELVTLSAENLEAAWTQSKDNCLTVWCNGTEVSDSYGGQLSSLLPLSSLPQARVCGFQQKPVTS